MKWCTQRYSFELVFSQPFKHQEILDQKLAVLKENVTSFTKQALGLVATRLSEDQLSKLKAPLFLPQMMTRYYNSLQEVKHSAAVVCKELSLSAMRLQQAKNYQRQLEITKEKKTLQEKIYFMKENE